MRRKRVENLQEYTQRELCEISERLNSWEWDDRIGAKPENWDALPKYNRHWYHKLIKRKTKADYIDPVLSFIRMLVPEKELLRFHNVDVLHMTNENFEQWWSKENISQSNLWQWW